MLFSFVVDVYGGQTVNSFYLSLTFVEVKMIKKHWCLSFVCVCGSQNVKQCQCLMVSDLWRSNFQSNIVDMWQGQSQNVLNMRFIDLLHLNTRTPQTLRFNVTVSNATSFWMPKSFLKSKHASASLKIWGGTVAIRPAAVCVFLSVSVLGGTLRIQPAAVWGPVSVCLWAVRVTCVCSLPLSPSPLDICA